MDSIWQLIVWWIAAGVLGLLGWLTGFSVLTWAGCFALLVIAAYTIASIWTE